MNIQPILNIAEVCVQKGIRHAVISPGSRSAPITLGFANHKNIECKIINDERSAAFIALGMALQLNEPVVLICTSGTAALNYAPAIAEAYYQQIPLLVLTADRPPELVDQQDGQCLRQFEIYKNYIKSSFQTPDNLDTVKSEKEVYSIIDHAVFQCNSSPLGPVHVNIPIREPFYPEKNIHYSLLNFESFNFSSRETKNHFSKLIEKINATKKVLFIAGQLQHNRTLHSYIETLINHHYPVITDINSNLCNVGGSIQKEDLIFQNDLEELHPELVVTFGNSILSKKLKLYFRDKNIEHWHIAETEPAPDFFFQIKGKYQCNPTEFFTSLVEVIKNGNKDYFEKWNIKNKQLNTENDKFLISCEWSEPYIIHKILKELPRGSHIHLSNSMTVRWVNMIGIEAEKNFTVQSNRGVSGIDGCTSTALGYSVYSNHPNFLFTGDIAFFYDRNAFWNDYIPNNLKIILLNNHAGGIFKLIDGPGNDKEKLPYFTSSQKLTAEPLANEFGLDYFFVDSKEKFNTQLNNFMNSKKCSILELKTDIKVNKEVFELLKHLK